MSRRAVIAAALLLGGGVPLATGAAQEAPPAGVPVPPFAAASQQPIAPPATGPREVSGVVFAPADPDAADPDGDGFAPLPGTWVVLHRVGPDAQGPIDSMRTGRDGIYRFRYTPSGSTEALYFVSASYGGIAYFTAPLRAERVAGRDAEIVVYDTTSADVPLTVRGRHLVVGAADSTGERTVVEIFELSNDGTRTRIADPEAGRPSWSVAVPPAALDLRAGEGDVTPEAFAQAGGRVSVFSPLTPGLKQFSFSYRLPASAFPLAYAMDGGAVALEILLEEQAASASGGGLVETDPVAIEGRRLRRLLAQDVEDGTVVTVDAPAPAFSWSGLYVTVLLGGAGIVMLLVLLRALTKRKRPLSFDLPPRVPAEEEVPTAERLAREIADLDAAFARLETPSESVRAAYAARRAELKRTLAGLLAETAGAR